MGGWGRRVSQRQASVRPPPEHNLHDRLGPCGHTRPWAWVPAPVSSLSCIPLPVQVWVHLPTVLELPFSPSFLLPPTQMPSASPRPGQHPLSLLPLAGVPYFGLLTCTEMSVSSHVPLAGLPTIHCGTGMTGLKAMALGNGAGDWDRSKLKCPEGLR